MRLEARSADAVPAALLAIVVALSPTGAGSEDAAVVEAEVTRRWLGPDGDPLPFQTDDEVLEFLRTAEVVGRRTVEAGINRFPRFDLERDGVRARAIFRTVDHELRRTRRPDGRYYVRWVDHYTGECAAYELARALGLGFVPPTVIRRFGTQRGSLQIWIEGARDEGAPDFQPPRPLAWVKQQWDLALFDNLILNVDRNAGNFLAGPDYRLWVYDHGRAFQPKPELLAPEKLRLVNRTVWDRLQSMSDEALKDVVREYLAPDQLIALVERRALLIEHVQTLADERGEEGVFY
jgi:hypothetical protein